VSTSGGPLPPRAEIQDQIIPFRLAVYERLDRLGTWAAESAATGEFLDWFHFRPGPDGNTASTAAVVTTWPGKRVWRDDDRSDSFQPTVTPPGEVRPMNVVSMWVLPLAVTTGD
jgi:hypothetical protein